MDTNIKFKIASSFSGEGFTKAEMALKSNRQELAAAKVGLGDVVNAFKEVSPATAEAVSGVQALTQAFTSGNIIAGLVQVGLKGIAWGIEKIIEVHKNAIEYTKKVGEAFDKAFIEILGDANARVRKHTADMEAMNHEADSMTKFLNAGIASELHDKIYRLHMEKLQEVTDGMTAGGKAVVEAEYAMKEATLKSKAALDIAANAMTNAGEKVANARDVEAEAEKALAESEYRLAQVNESMSKNADAVRRATEEHEIAERNLADATRARENAERESTMAEQKFNAAQQDHILTIKEHEQKIKEANKKLDEEAIARNELRLKEEEAAAKWKEYLSGAFDREMNARNELAKKEEDASLAFKNFIDGLKKSAWGNPEDRDVDTYLEELEEILDPNKRKKNTASANAVAISNIPEPVHAVVQQNDPQVRGFGEHLKDVRNNARQQRNLMSELSGKYDREIQQYELAKSTDRDHRTQLQNQLVEYYEQTFIPSLLSQYGPNVVDTLFSNANGKVMLKSDYETFFSQGGGFFQALQLTIENLGLGLK